ncbi:MAG: hypothetical protein DID92_2727745667 [Candidatus Nitrotoga sp. SPKER]|nr:MAG: hypothetical protein DID92_2727745667 [Candidatus Nitrotoga sp. SPKER]
MLELGRMLTKELDLDQSVDTLGRWMAHYIAELINDTENASAEERPTKMRACSEAILSLWKHRHELPSGKRPFETLEPILRTLESLDPNDDTPRYFRTVRSAAEEGDDDGDTKSWLKIIDGLDYSAKILIRYCLSQAAKNALDKSAEWVLLAEAVGEEDGIEFPVIRIIVDETNLLKEPDPDGETRKQLEDRLSRLEGFTNMATALTSQLRQKIQKI